MKVITREGEGGRVFVVDVADSVRGYPRRYAFTSTTDVADATVFDDDEVLDLLQTHSWRAARAEPAL